MTEYLPAQKQESRTLARNEYLEVAFEVEHRGQITVYAHAPWYKEWDTESHSWLTNPTKRRVDLFSPGGDTPVVTRTDEGKQETTSFVYNITSEAGQAGVWKARVTNLEARSEMFKLTVNYPSNTPIEVFRVPVSVVEALVAPMVGQISIRITRGANASRIVFPDSIREEPIYFTVEDFVFDPWWWLLPAIKEYPNDINSSKITVSLEDATADYSRGFIRIAVRFEEQGKEILGTWHGQMSNMLLTINLGLLAIDRQISYYNVGVSFPCQVDMLGVPDSVVDPIIGYADDIRETVTGTVRSVFRTEAIRKALSEAITKEVLRVLGANAKIWSVQVQDGQLEIHYYKA